MKKKLKIAQIAPLSVRVPPKKYGGTERVVHAITEGLVRQGHDVTLFASGDSETHAKLSSVYPKSLRDAKINDPYGINELTLLHVAYAYKKQDEFDIIHDHNGVFSITAAQYAKTPVISTIHGLITLANRRLFKIDNAPHLVGISHDQIKNDRNLHFEGVVYNGLALKNYPFNTGHQGFLLFVGRIAMDKGPHLAIRVAQELGIPLILAAKLDMEDVSYFKKYIQPRLDGELVHWVGEVNEDERNKLMSRAMCLLYPLTWSEPFGLVMIEAMACGCPVIAFNEGSVSELIIDQKTGFIVSDIEEMISAVENIATIKRKDCRQHALSKFNDSRMVKGYEDMYYKVLSENR